MARGWRARPHLNHFRGVIEYRSRCAGGVVCDVGSGAGERTIKQNIPFGAVFIAHDNADVCRVPFTREIVLQALKRCIGGGPGKFDIELSH